MALSEELRRQILVELRATGEGVADRVAQELERLKRQVAEFTQQLGNNTITFGEYFDLIKGLQGQIAPLQALYQTATEAITGLDKATLESIRNQDKWIAQLAKTSDQVNKLFEQEAAAAERAAMAEAEAIAKGAEQAETATAKREAAAEKEEMQDAQRLAKMAERAEAEAAKREATAEREEMREAERLANMAAQQEAFLERQAQQEEQNAREIAAARASLDLQRQEALKAEQRLIENRDAAFSNRNTEQSIQRFLELLGQEERQIGTNVQRLQALTAQFEKLGQAQASWTSLAPLAEEIGRLEQDIGLFGERTMIAARSQDEFNTVINAGAGYAKNYAQSQAQVTRSVEETSGRFGTFALTTLALGHTIQDLTSANGDLVRGLSATLNNIPMLTVGFAQLAGVSTQNAMILAGGLTAVASITMAVYQNWDTLMDKMGAGIPRPVLDSTKELSTDLKEAEKEFGALGEKTRMSLSELQRYKELNGEILDLRKQLREEREYEELAKLQPEEAGQVSTGVKKAIAEGGGRDQAFAEVQQALYNEALRTGADYTLEGLNEEAQRLLRESTAGTGYSQEARDRIATLLKQNIPGQQRTAFERGLAEFSPEAKEEATRVDQEYEAVSQELDESNRRAKLAREARQRRAKEQQKLVDDLNRQGQENQLIGAQEAEMDQERAQREREQAIRRQPAEQRRAQREQRAGLQQEVAGRLQEDYPQLNNQQAMQAAQSAIGFMQQRIDPVMAGQMAITELMAQISRTQEKFMNDHARVMMGIQGVHAQQRRMRQMAPTLQPTIPSI